MTIEQKEDIVKKYVVAGIPESIMDGLCRELNVNRERFDEFMNGQTMGVIGSEGLYYEEDVMRFIKGLPVID